MNRRDSGGRAGSAAHASNASNRLARDPRRSLCAVRRRGRNGPVGGLPVPMPLRSDACAGLAVCRTHAQRGSQSGRDQHVAV